MESLREPISANQAPGFITSLTGLTATVESADLLMMSNRSSKRLSATFQTEFVRLPNPFEFMENIRVEIFDEGANYACGWGYDGFGAVICADKSIKNLKLKFEKTLAEQISDMVADGEPIPQWLASGNYKIEYSLHD